MDNYVRCSQHAIKFSNTNKKLILNAFIHEYRRIGQEFLDYIWENGYSWTYKDGNIHVFDVNKNLLYFPSYIDYNSIPISDTFLTARALSSLVTQIAGMISAACEKQRKRLYQLNKFKENGVEKRKYASLIKKIKQNIPQKPNTKQLNLELSSKCIDYEASEGEFVGFIRLKSFSKIHDHIRIPIKAHKQYKKLAKNGTQMTSYLISDKWISVRWKIEKKEIKKSGEVIGVDQGLKDVITCSNGFTANKTDIHGHSLDSILDEMTRKKPGSKGYKRKQEHRKNFINWSINQLNLDDIKEVRLEEIINIGYKQKRSKKLSRWTNVLIRDKIESNCEERGVRFTLVSSTYRSQRCNCCGIVCKSNRKGKLYKCRHCGHEMDADLNASLNLCMELPEIPYHLRKLCLNRGHGFYWNSSGFFDYITGRSLESLLQQKDKLQ